MNSYCGKYAFPLDYAAMMAIGRGTCEIPRVSGQLFGKSRLICVKGSNTFLTWLKVWWELGVSGENCPFPNGFTHLMITAWLCRGL